MDDSQGVIWARQVNFCLQQHLSIGQRRCGSSLTYELDVAVDFVGLLLICISKLKRVCKRTRLDCLTEGHPIHVHQVVEEAKSGDMMLKLLTLGDVLFCNLAF